MKQNLTLLIIILFICYKNSRSQNGQIKCGDKIYSTTECECCANDKCVSLLRCPLKPHSDFDILVTTLIIIGAFVIGIPLMIFVIDFLIVERPFGCKMSCCELVANYVCCCFCFRYPKKKLSEVQY